MNTTKILTPFFDLKDKSHGKCGFFFLEHILKAREELHMESSENTYDQELNVYIAGLLNSLIFDSIALYQKPYISRFDFEIQNYLSRNPGLRNRYTVYRENADFNLLFTGLFSGYFHKNSNHRSSISYCVETGRISLYYEFAAHALAHLQGNTSSLIEVFETLARNIKEIIKILNYAASCYFNMIENISEGSMFHLERELDEIKARKEYETKLDSFLQCYALYIKQPSQKNKECVMSFAEELKRLNSNFNFSIVK